MKYLASLVLALSTLNGHAFIVEFMVYSETCAGGDGAIIATAIGGQAPYSYVWSNAVNGPANYFLSAGTYSVTVTDNAGATATKQWTLGQVLQPPSNVDQFSYLGLGGLDACPGQCNGGFRLHLPRIPGGYTFNTTPSMTYSLVGSDVGDYVNNGEVYEFLGACSSQSIQLSISNSCGTGYTSGIVVGTETEPVVSILQLGGSCNGADDGLLSAEVTVPMPPSTWCSWALVVTDGQGGSAEPDGVLFTSPWTDVTTVEGLHPGDWTLDFTTEESENSQQTPCTFSLPFTIPDLGPDCATVSGVVHFETDADCTLNGTDAGIPYQMLRLTPGPLYGITAADGTYSVAAPYGTYDLEQLNPSVVQLCPPVAPASFTLSSGTNAQVDLADSLSSPFNLSTHLWSTVSRVGMPFTYHIDVANHDGHVADDLTITLSYDPLFSFVSANPAPSATAAGTAEWTFASLAPFEHRHVSVKLQVPPDPLLLGTDHSATATASTSAAEATTTDNSDTDTQTIVSSYDPNDKQAFTSSEQNNAVYLVDVDEYIDYLIRFQNTGTDTAFTITVTDTISPLLDMASLQVIGASHAFTPSIATGNVLRFVFADILLPDSNVNEGASHGYVAFRMKPLEGIALGSVINNAADIYFDFNAPVRTNTTAVTLGITTDVASEDLPAMHLSPIPATDRLSVRVDGAALVQATVHALDGRAVQVPTDAQGVDVSGLTGGAYVLHARCSDGRVLRQRFLKR